MLFYTVFRGLPFVPIDEMESLRARGVVQIHRLMKRLDGSVASNCGEELEVPRVQGALGDETFSLAAEIDCSVHCEVGERG